MGKFREKILPSEIKIILGKDKEGNDELARKFKGKKNTILHTVAPGSPFGVIKKLKPSEDEVYLSGAIVARYSQAWRDNKSDVMVDVFTGKDIYKTRDMPVGTWGVKKKKSIIIEKKTILSLIEREKSK